MVQTKHVAKKHKVNVEWTLAILISRMLCKPRNNNNPINCGGAWQETACRLTRSWVRVRMRVLTASWWAVEGCLENWR